MKWWGRRGKDMEIKILDLTNDEIEAGYEIGQVLNVNTVEIIGDTTGYDLYYKDDKGTYFHDIIVEQMNEDSDLDKVLMVINKLDYEIAASFKIVVNVG